MRGDAADLDEYARRQPREAAKRIGDIEAATRQEDNFCIPIVDESSADKAVCCEGLALDEHAGRSLASYPHAALDVRSSGFYLMFSSIGL
jgi:hypothetical protein